jgi:hypothetical protein
MSLFVGTSLGKCLKDLLDGTVKEHEVLVIVTNTMCPTLDRLMDVVDQYYYDGNSRGHAYDLSAHTLEDAQSLAQRLFESGKLHQPRCLQAIGQRANAHNLRDTWYDIIPSAVAGDLADNANIQEAFDRYRALAVLLT